MKYEYHPLANIFPLMEGEEYAKFKKDIADNGQREAIWLTPEGQILDGRNRYRACVELGIEPKFQTYADNHLLEFVISLNLHRRHLESFQRACIAQEVLPYLKEQAKERQVASQNNDTGRAVREKVPQQEQGKSRDVAAKMLNTNGKYVDEAAALKEADPELFEKAKAGKASRKQARQVVTKRKQEEAKEYQAAVAAVEPEPIIIKPGEWWRLGRHLLYCGDTAKPEFYSNIPTPTFAFADPPYNAGVDDWDASFSWAHDWLSAKAPIVAVTPGIASLQSFLRDTSMPYVWSMACWIDNGMTRGALGFGNWIPIALFSPASLHRNAQDFLRVSIKNNEGKDFKGQKPFALIEQLITLFSEKGDQVCDPFLGSGTTLFVAERTGRACVGGELRPEQCASVIGAWQSITGQKAEVL